MARWIPQNTTVTIPMGPFLASTDGVTAQAGLGSFTVRVNKGTTWVIRESVTATAHQENGFYSVELNATDTNTLGRLRVAANPSTAIPVWEDFMVVPANIYNALVAGTDTLHVDTIQWLGTAVATPTVAGVPEVDLTHVNGVINANAVLQLRQILLSNSTGPGLSIETTANNLSAVEVASNGSAVSSGTGLSIAGAAAGPALRLVGGSTLGAALELQVAVGEEPVNGVLINAASADALLDRAIAEPTAVWAWPVTLRKLAQWLGALSRNKVTQTNTTQTLRNDADSATIATSTHSDDGTTHTRGEFS